MPLTQRWWQDGHSRVIRLLSQRGVCPAYGGQHLARRTGTSRVPDAQSQMCSDAALTVPCRCSGRIEPVMPTLRSWCTFRTKSFHQPVRRFGRSGEGCPSSCGGPAGGMPRDHEGKSQSGCPLVARSHGPALPRPPPPPVRLRPPVLGPRPLRSRWRAALGPSHPRSRSLSLTRSLVTPRYRLPCAKEGATKQTDMSIIGRWPG